MKTATARVASLLGLVLLHLSPLAAEVRDGKLHDPEIARTAPADGAPKELVRLAPIVGQWDVELEIFRPEAEPLRSTGIAAITFMNRGHSLMERTRITDFDGEGHALATLDFFAVAPDGTWTVSGGESWAEAITVYSGGYDGESLVVHDAFRPGGGLTLMLLRRTYAAQRLQSDGIFTKTLEISTDRGATWTRRSHQTYRRRAASAEFFPVREDVGLPAPDRPTEAAQFDFLLGEFDASHWLRRPDTVLEWRANATAVRVLDGHGILEVGWHDVDPSLPDATTTILRLYNRSMRRWESLFLTNRNNTPLHFGGVREADGRIVLHPFAAQTGSYPLSQWIFYDIGDDTYHWKGLQSQDRGATWTPNWTIDFVRKGTPTEVNSQN